MATLIEEGRANTLAQAYSLACTRDDECAKHHGLK
jgi:hypothetical protein